MSAGDEGFFKLKEVEKQYELSLDIEVRQGQPPLSWAQSAQTE